MLLKEGERGIGVLIRGVYSSVYGDMEIKN